MPPRHDLIIVGFPDKLRAFQEKSCKALGESPEGKGRTANACALTGMRVQIPCLPLVVGCFVRPDGEMDITPRFYRGIPGSSPGRGVRFGCPLRPGREMVPVV